MQNVVVKTPVSFALYFSPYGRPGEPCNTNIRANRCAAEDAASSDLGKSSEFQAGENVPLASSLSATFCPGIFYPGGVGATEHECLHSSLLSVIPPIAYSSCVSEMRSSAGIHSTPKYTIFDISIHSTMRSLSHSVDGANMYIYQCAWYAGTFAAIEIQKCFGKRTQPTDTTCYRGAPVMRGTGKRRRGMGIATLDLRMGGGVQRSTLFSFLLPKPA